MLEPCWDWLRENTSVRQVGDFVEITTPFLDRHNDCIAVYVRREEDGYVLTDLGETIGDLELCGFGIGDSPRRKELFRGVLDRFDVRPNGKDLEVRATRENFGLRKHSLLQAMLAVSDLFYLASWTIPRTFRADVGRWLESSRITHSADVKFEGRSGLSHRFDFVVPHSKHRPERVVSAVSPPGRASATRLAFSWLDAKGERSAEVAAYALLDDSEGKAPERVEKALATYGIRAVPWGRRESLLEHLSG